MAEGTIGGTKLSALPASSYAYCEPGTDAPSTRCHFPIRDASGKPDAAHVRNALARLDQSPFGAKARAKVMAAAKELGIGQKASLAAMHSSEGAEILSDLYELLSCEADEPDQAPLLAQAAELVGRWIDLERQEIGGPGDLDESTDMLPADMGQKSFTEWKAEPMSGSQLDKWLRGSIARRVLVLPFGGPIPRKGAPLGVDLDGEWFDAATDAYGPYPALRSSRERLVDWHHGNDPTGRMKGAILGRVELDAEPENDGLWGSFWANAGETRRKLIAQLERGDVPLYGSSEAVPGAVRKAASGHIDVWPIIRHTITTSPQNTWAVVPPLKAILSAEFLPLNEIGPAAIKAAMLGLADHLADLRPTFSPEAADTFLPGAASDAAKAGVPINTLVTAGVVAVMRRIAP